MEQLEKSSKAVEESFRLTTEKMEMLQGKIHELQGAEKAAAEAKEQIQEMKLAHANVLASKKEEEARLTQSLTDLQKELDRRQKQFYDEMVRLKKDHTRELDLIRKDLEMKAKEESQLRINHINEQHAEKMAELIDRMHHGKN